MPRSSPFVMRSVVVIAVCVVGVTSIRAAQAPRMTAHFINVGQAHATLLEFPCGAMLIDAGAQDEDHTAALMNYLEAFFERRADLARTLNVVLITHNHIDHTRALRTLAETFTLQRFIDNGFATGSGAGGPNWLRSEVASGRLTTFVRDIADAEIDLVTDRTGLTDADIDPFTCVGVDPMVRILQGRFDENPGWPEGEFENQNNHSLVTRVDFGSASFLFMGDVEEAGIELLTSYYGAATNGMLNADVIQVGHHGSHNATTTELLHAVTPRVAVIPVGEWTFGQSGGTFTTFAFGHPRRVTVDLLSAHITRRRSPAKSVKVANKSKQFVTRTVTKAIYASGWDGTIRVVAETAGQLTVYREH